MFPFFEGVDVYMIQLTKQQARQFLLLKHGLMDSYRFLGKQGVVDFVRQVGCIQYDPIDVCGKNAELVLQSRVKGFHKEMLEELLYQDRLLVDYPDKNLAIIPLEDWPYFERYRQAARQHEQSFPQMKELKRQVLTSIQNNGPLSSHELKVDGDFTWQSAIHWSGGTNVSRSMLEQMYSAGELIIHHKKGTRKYYDVAKNYIPSNLLNAAEPLEDELEHYKWRVLRRIGGVGLLWNRASDAWLHIWGLKATQRNEVFRQLLIEGEIVEITVASIKDTLYCLRADLPLVEAVLQNQIAITKQRCELIAPLDNLIWDRKLIHMLFDFDYTWEIYTPASKRKFGHYVLPLLYGDKFVGRSEIVALRKEGILVVKGIWLESGIKLTNKLRTSLKDCFHRFALFNDCQVLKIESEF